MNVARLASPPLLPAPHRSAPVEKKRLKDGVQLGAQPSSVPRLRGPRCAAGLRRRGTPRQRRGRPLHERGGAERGEYLTWAAKSEVSDSQRAGGRELASLQCELMLRFQAKKKFYKVAEQRPSVI